MRTTEKVNSGITANPPHAGATLFHGMAKLHMGIHMNLPMSPFLGPFLGPMLALIPSENLWKTRTAKFKN
jgi:hypothetical protein